MVDTTDFSPSIGTNFMVSTPRVTEIKRLQDELIIRSYASESSILKSDSLRRDAVKVLANLIALNAARYTVWFLEKLRKFSLNPREQSEIPTPQPILPRLGLNTSCI